MDKQIICNICNKLFTWSSGEQTFFKKKGFHEPKKCPDCRTSKNQQTPSYISSHDIDQEALEWGRNLLNNTPSSKQEESTVQLLEKTETQHIKENRLTKEALSEGEESKNEAIKKAANFKSLRLDVFIIDCIIIFFLYQFMGETTLFFIIAGTLAASFLFFLADGVPPDENEIWTNPIKLAGAEGEDIVLERLLSLKGKYILFNQIEVPDPKGRSRKTEIDLLLLNNQGLYVIEVKHQRGDITGSKDDPTLKLTKLSHSGYIYENELKNPIKQLNWQIYALKSYLKKYNLDIWVSGYVIYSNSQCTLNITNNKPETIIHIHDIDPSLFNQGYPLGNKTIRDIESALSKTL